MDVSVVNSVLSINNHFYKVFKRIIDKKSKNESFSAELEWISAQLLHENRKICENSVNVLVEIGKFDFGLASNCLISALSRAPNYDLLCNGIFQLLRDVKQKFGITEKAHPGILMISDSSEKMLYLSQKIEEILNDKHFEDPVNFLKPVLLMIQCSDTIYAESREIWRHLIVNKNHQIVEEILGLRRVTSLSSCTLFNSMALQKFKATKSPDDLLLLIVSTKYLVEFSLDPTINIDVISCNQELLNSPQHLNIAMLILAELLQKISITFIPKLIDLLCVMIMERKFTHLVILPMILDGLVQVIAYPSFASKEMKNVEKLFNFIRECDDKKVISMPNFHHFNHDVTRAFEICKFFESQNFAFKKISTDHEKNFWRRHQLVLRGLLHSNVLNYDQWLIVLHNLIEISKSDDELKSSLVMPLLFRLTESSEAKVKVAILQNLTQLGASTEVFSTIKALSQGMLRSMAIDLHLRLWKIEPRTYPHLYKVLVEKSSRDDEDFYLSIVQASAIKEICDLKPHHGSDLVTLISDILNKSLESKDCEIPAALAIDAIIILCENHIINITSTWKAISVTTRYEKRPRVVKSLCNFFALVPKFKRSNSEYELLMKEIVERIFHMIQWSDKHGIECALEAFKSWRYDQLTMDMIPDTFREGIALPEAGVGMEVSILDLEVPGECFVQMLTKAKALESVGDLISHFIGQEILDYRSGTYIVKEGQPEPISYKNLPKQSIVKVITQFVIQQATTKKSEKIVSEEILIEALKILSRKYFRPLPPLNWTFLHELVHKSQEVKAQCLAIVSKQSVISGTAKRLAENILININFDDSEDIEAALEILAELCNGISNDVLKIFFEKAVKNEKINESMQKCLSSEKDITNRENLAAIISIYVKSSARISKETIKKIPSNIMPMISLDSTQKIEFRCEILKENSKVENAVGWINELITEQYSKSDHRELFIESFIDLLTHEKQSFPKLKWLTDFMAMTENKMIEKGNLDFLLDIFCIAIICFSGCFKLFGRDKIFINRFKFFAQAVEIVSCQENFAEIIGSIFDFIYFVIDHQVSECYQKAFKDSLIAAKNHSHFKKPKTWNKILQAVAISN